MSNDLDDIFGKMMGDNDDGSKDDYNYQMPIRSKNEVSEDIHRQATDLDVLIDSIKGRHAERFNLVLQTMSDREFVNAYLGVLKFVKPTYKPVESEKPVQKERKLRITHVTKKS